MTQNNETAAWLCRNCNTLVDNDLNTCPSCNALRPEVETDTEPTPEGVANEVKVENYANPAPQKSEYTFKESILRTVADISLALGLFFTFGALIAPVVIEHDLSHYTAMMTAITAAIVIFATTMVSWAILRVLADISRRTREIHERLTK